MYVYAEALRHLDIWGKGEKDGCIRKFGIKMKVNCERPAACMVAYIRGAGRGFRGKQMDQMLSELQSLPQYKYELRI